MMCCSGGGTLFSTTPNVMVNAHPYKKYYRFPTLHKLFFSDHRKRLHLLPPGYRKIVSMEKFDGGFGFGSGGGGCGCCAAMMQQQSCGCGGGGMMSPRILPPMQSPCGCNGGGGEMAGFPYHNQYNSFQNRYKNTSERIYKKCRHKCSKKIGPLRRRRCKRRCKRQKKRRNRRHRRNEKIWMTGPNGRSYEARHMMGPREFQRQLTPVTGTYPPRGYCRKAQRIYNPYYQAMKRMRKFQRRQMRLYRSPYGYGGAMIGGGSCGCRGGDSGIRQSNVPLITNGLGSVYGYNPVLQSLGLKNPRQYALSKPSCSTFTPYVGPRPVGRELFVPPMMMPVPKWMIGPNGLNGNMMGRYGVRYPMMGYSSGYGRMGGMMGGMGGMMNPMMGGGMMSPMMRMNPMMMMNNPMMMNPMMRRF